MGCTGGDSENEVGFVLLSLPPGPACLFLLVLQRVFSVVVPQPILYLLGISGWHGNENFTSERSDYTDYKILNQKMGKRQFILFYLLFGNTFILNADLFINYLVVQYLEAAALY